ncbi:hypothetical protein [Paenibacillus soyae]|uniref:DUF5590 domain-containing protein n=1 Tax=Paenibacillus soyae TaxID=2969249 RepID=A0A9X2S7E7_9BACL|nr:hypothetical protein [Paenibacillus soyae]MCR2802971.1 hypothetical protein [Paenibacillus soyae]
MTPKRWLIIAAAALITLLVWFGLYFHDIQKPQWTLERNMSQAAIQTGDISEVDELFMHVWESKTWIAEGEDENGRRSYVFLTGEGEPLFTVEAEDVMTEEDVRARFEAENANEPEIDMIRLQPGLLRESPVWEVYYSLIRDGVRRYYYQFYSFDRDADLIETYKLPAKTGP